MSTATLLADRVDEALHGSHPTIVEPTDAIVRLSAASICGSDLWPLGVTHDVQLPGMELFFSHVHLHGGPAPVRRFLPEHLELIADGTIEPGKVFDLTLPLEEAAEGYRATDERRAVKTLLRL